MNPALVGGAQIGVMMEGAEASWTGFPSGTDLDYLKSHGVDLVRLPIAWELMQGTLNGPLTQTYLGKLETFLQQAADRGMQVMVTLMNYGEYDPNWQQVAAANNGMFTSAGALGQSIGSSAVPVSSFVNFWSQLSKALSGHPGLAGYDLMNEPQGGIPNSTWQAAAQGAVNAIRAVDMQSTVYVAGNNWGAAETWPLSSYNATLHITDPANKIVYEAHQYLEDGGLYKQPFDSQKDYANKGVDLIQPFINWLQANGAEGMIGEFGAPVKDPRWLPLLDAMMDTLQANDIPAVYCNYGYNLVGYQFPTGSITIDPVNGLGAATMELIFKHTAPSITQYVPQNGTGSNGISTANVLTLSGTGASYCTVKVYDNGQLIGTTVSNISGAWSLKTATLANGAHNFTATNIDAAGTTSESSYSLAVTVAANGGAAVTPPTAPSTPSTPTDKTAPVAPTIASFSNDSGVVSDHITNDNTLTLTGTAEAGSTVKLYDGAMLLGNAVASGTGAWSYTTAALANGGHNLTTTATDAAGNTGVASTALAVTIDRTAPAAAAIASFSTDSGVVGDHITNDNTLTLTGTAEAGSTVKVYDGATLLGSATTNGNGAWSYTTAALANGGHNLTATATDAAGNTGVASTALAVTINTTVPTAPAADRTAPTPPAIASVSTDSGVAGDHITNDNTLTLSGTAEANAKVQVYDGTTLLGNATANSGGAWSYTTAARPNGTHKLTATATDAAGNTGAASTALVVTIDRTAPAAPAIASFSTDTGVVGDHITRDKTPTLTGTAEAGSTVKVYDGATPLGSATANSSGAWSYTMAALSPGAHSLTAIATDAAGNTGVASTALAVTIGKPAARAIASFSTDSVVGDHMTSDKTLTLTGTGEAGSTVKVYDGTTLLNGLTASGGGASSHTTAALSNGGHNLTAADAAGNTGAASSAVTVDTSNSAHDTGATVPGSIDLRTLGLTEDHTVRAVIGQIFEQHFDNLRDGNKHSFKNHGVDADTLHQIESATGFDIIAHNHGSKHIRPDTIVSDGTHGAAAEDPTASHLIIGSHGPDKLTGGPNADVLVAGHGQHVMTGMGGADTFVIGKGHVDATITDFTPGVDKLGFISPAEHGNTVQIRQENGDAVVTVGHDHVVLTGVDLHQLHPHDLMKFLV